jgi:hypothetical protein
LLDTLGNIGEFVGGIAVLATLVYLALQIRENTRALRVTSHQEAGRLAAGLNYAIANHPDFAELLVRSLESPESLSPAERLRLEAWADNCLGTYEAIFWQRDHGFVDSAMWHAWEHGLLSNMTPFLRGFWAANKKRYHPSFREHVDAALEAARPIEQFYDSHPPKR